MLLRDCLLTCPYSFSIIILALIHLFSCVIIFLNKDQVRQHLVSTIGLDGLSLLKAFRNKNPPSAVNLGVGFYFLLLLLMYVKSARMNVPNNSIRVIASFTSMVSPPFEGKPYPPKIQLYLYFTCSYICVQAFPSDFCIFFHYVAPMSIIYVCVFTNPAHAGCPANAGPRTNVRSVNIMLDDVIAFLDYLTNILYKNLTNHCFNHSFIS